MMILPSVRHLRYLTALHDHGHFGRAAEACHVTQSTLSASIKELESVLQVTLVDRSKRHVVLTPVGVETVELREPQAGSLIDARATVDLFRFAGERPRRYKLGGHGHWCRAIARKEQEA